MAKPRARSAAEVVTKRMRFSKAANSRMIAAIKALRRVGELTASRYSGDCFCHADVVKMTDALNFELQQITARLEAAAPGHQLDVEFDLDRPFEDATPHLVEGELHEVTNAA